MRKSALYLAISLMFPLHLYALGLGELKVYSHLNEPFSAEVDLLDVGGLPLTSIKPSLGTPEEFEQLGLTRDPVLADIMLEVVRNPAGQFVIKLTSTRRIRAPYLELVIDVAWTHGELYRNYTVLLDPPRYRLDEYGESALYKALPEREKREHESRAWRVHPKTQPPLRPETTYGPTLVNETVEQIARHYLTERLTLPQVMLAIVGRNPNAFMSDNLNGLKVASTLIIPSEQQMLSISPTLALQEINAQNLAWKDKSPVKHVLPPPYLMNTPLDNINEQTVVLPSVIPSWMDKASSLTNILPAPTQGVVSNALSEAKLAIEAKVRALEKRNQELEKQLKQSLEDNKVLTQKLTYLQADWARMSSLLQKQEGGISLYWLFLLLLAGGGGYYYWQQRRKKEEVEWVAPETPPALDSTVEATPSSEEAASSSLSSETPPTLTPQVSSPSEPTSETVTWADGPGEEAELGAAGLNEEKETIPVLDLSSENVTNLGDEPERMAKEEMSVSEAGLDSVAKPTPESAPEPVSQSLPEPTPEPAPELTLEPAPEPVLESAQEPQLVKSREALATLLELTKVYISRGDMQAAKQALAEIFKFGDEEQQKQAIELLKQCSEDEK